MKKFNYKSRKGFTLIELLVVIGILAVLAAIAIPSVAGLIDRANVSADDTNANEMTNALERFTSEYELFCQDIASGRFNKNDMDAAQSRVYNVTGAEDRDDIKDLESEDGLDGKKINRDTKYPENIDTTKTIVENYTKTSSATYEPKQSDMNFYYSPDCGVIVFADASTSIDVTDIELIKKLNGKIISGKDAKGKVLDETTEWLNLSIDANNEIFNETELNHGSAIGDLIPEGATYFDVSKRVTLYANEPFPTEVETGDIYTYGDYKYYYNLIGNTLDGKVQNPSQNGWGVHVTTLDKEIYPAMLESIAGKPITALDYMFRDCQNLVTLADNFRIPKTVVSLDRMFLDTSIQYLPNNFTIPASVKTIPAMFRNATKLSSLPSSFKLGENVVDANSLFHNCESLTSLPDNFTLNKNLKDAGSMFKNCTSLKTLPNTFKLNEGIEDISYMFSNCTSLETLPPSFTIIPSSVTTARQMFEKCTSLSSLPNNFTILNGVSQIVGMFTECTSLEAHIIINANPTYYNKMLYNVKNVTISGTSTLLNQIVETKGNGNVLIA